LISALLTSDPLVQGKEPNLTRRRVTRSELRHLDPVIERLTAERLLVKDNRTIEVAHEALFSAWDRYRDWITENSESIQRRDRLQAYCTEWDKHCKQDLPQTERKQKTEDYLLSVGRLAEFEEWQTRTEFKLTNLQEEFLRKSREKCNRQQREEEERQHREIDGLKKLVKAETDRKKLSIACMAQRDVAWDEAVACVARMICHSRTSGAAIGFDEGT